MELKERIASDLKLALKSGDNFKLGVLRFLSAAIHNREIDAKAKSGSGTLSEEEVQKVLLAEAKKRKEAIEIYLSGGRGDLAEKEACELQEIRVYLPKELSPEEIEKKVREIAGRVGSKDFGAVMKAVMAELRGQADAKFASEIVRRIIGQ